MFTVVENAKILNDFELFADLTHKIINYLRVSCLEQLVPLYISMKYASLMLLSTFQDY